MENKYNSPVKKMPRPSLKGDAKGAFDHNPNPAFNNPRDTSGMLPQRFSDDGVLTGSKRGMNKMNTPAKGLGEASMSSSTTVKKGGNKYNSAGKTKQQGK